MTMALRRVWIASPNCSGRGGSGVRIVVVHTAEGARGFRSLGSFFANPSSQVSSHVGIDDERGVIGEYVHRPDKAWTQSNYNPQAVSAELCGSPIGTSTPCGANWSRAEWMQHMDMLQNTADWIAEECAHYGLPIVKLSSAQAQGSGRGVCGHVDLGVGGGGHHDPGPNFPWSEVMDMARRGGRPPTALKPKVEDENMIASCVSGQNVLHTFVADADEVRVAWQNKDGSWTGSGGGYMAKMQHFCKVPTGHKIVAISATTARSMLHVFVRTEDSASWVTWQATDGKWHGAGGGYPAGLTHFAGPIPA